jgi:hypothetical protein
LSERQVDEQIRQGFTALTRPPRPQLTERIRDSLWSRRAGGRPKAVPMPPPVPVLVAGALVVVLVAAVLLGPAAVRAATSIGRGVNGAVARVLTPPRPASTPSRGQSAVAHGSPSARPTVTAAATPAPTPVPTATPTPVPTPTAPVATLPGYSCAAQSGGGGQATMSTARVGAQSGYDRFVIQFVGPVPQFEVSLQDSASFAQNGGSVTLQGAAGLQVVLHDATGAGVYSGPSDVKVGFPEIQEARLLSDAQGEVQWGVGIAHAACFHAWVLPSPSRLVVDVAT